MGRRIQGNQYLTKNFHLADKIKKDPTKLWAVGPKMKEISINSIKKFLDRNLYGN